MPEKFKPGLSFRFLTPSYDTVANLLGLGIPLVRRLIQVLQMAGIKGNESVLDIGCGTGTLIIGLKKIYPELMITGLDADPDILKTAGRKLQDTRVTADLVHGVIQQLPFPAGSFDIVTSSLMFHHLPADVKQEGIKEVRRVLKDSGWFLLADFGKPETIGAKVLLNLSSLLDGRAGMRENLHGLLPPALEKAGFRVQDVGPRYRWVQFLLAKKLAERA
jgi:ubiquinone/menaquinone biosynthesis C-methylase UbiE